MKKKKKEKYPTGNIIKDFPSYPDNYKDHRKFIYTIGKSKERKLNSNVWKEVWSVVEWRNVIPPRVVNLWSFPTKEDAENFMKKNDLVIPSKQN
jgi:hypothetical protein|tara:strand:+ start:192 stop:473 length:282 start_codon:yes stop_codon:yes gene_type:complete